MDRQPRLVTLLLIATLPLIVAWYAAGDSRAPVRAASATPPAATQPPASRRAAAAPARVRPAARSAPARPPTEAARRKALIHPLIGMGSARLIRALGRPTARSSETGLTFLEYHLPEAHYQLVLVDRRVVEVNRIR